MGTDGLDRTRPKSTNSIVVEGIERLAALLCRDVNPAWFYLWTQALSDLDNKTLARCFRELERTFRPTLACPFPTPAHLRDLIEKRANLAMEQEAEKSWQDFIEAMEKYWYPDFGWKGPEIINKRVMRAVDAAGGIAAIYNETAKELVWRKKEFLAAYIREEELEQASDLLPASEIKPLLEKTVKNLRIQKTEQGCVPPLNIQTGATRPISEKPRVIEETDEQFRARMDEQKRRLDEWVKNRGNAKAQSD